MKSHICYSVTHIPTGLQGYRATGLQYIGYTSRGLKYRKAQHTNHAKRVSSGKERPKSLLALAINE